MRYPDSLLVRWGKGRLNSAMCKIALLLLGIGVHMLGMGQGLPAYQGFVNDFSDLLSPSEVEKLEAYLTRQAEATSNEVAVVIMNLPEGVAMRDYTLDLAESWGIGSADNDNGVLVALFPNAREVVIEVGYGLEGAIPDLASYNIIQKDMIPHFREEEYFEGLMLGVKALHTLGTGEYPDAIRKKYYSNTLSRSTSRGPNDFQIFGIVLFVFIYILISSGGGGGGGGGGHRRGRGYHDRGPYWWGPVGGYRSSNWGGGSWGGGGFSGGGGSFGGFSGGSFGGGGSSGSW